MRADFFHSYYTKAKTCLIELPKRNSQGVRVT